MHEGESVLGSKRSFPEQIYAVSVLICLLSSVAWSQGEGVHIGELLKDEIRVAAPPPA